MMFHGDATLWERYPGTTARDRCEGDRDPFLRNLAPTTAYRDRRRADSDRRDASLCPRRGARDPRGGVLDPQYG